MNCFTGTGRLTRDPDIRTTNNGKTVANFSIAIRENKNEVSYIDVTVWDKLAELVSNYCTKGKMIGVQGRLKQDTWEKDGKKNSKIFVMGEKIDFIGGNEKAENGSNDADDTEEVQEEAVVANGGVPF